MVKNCDLGLENTALGLRPRAVFHHKDLQPASNLHPFLVVKFAYTYKTLLHGD